MISDANDWKRKIVDVHGEAGAAWLDRLPELLAGYAERWGLTLLPPFAQLSYNYVAPVIRQDGTPAVLKAGVPNTELFGEIEALRWFDGQGTVRLLEADPQRGVLLLERLLPGTPLELLQDDDQVTIVAVRVMQRLWRPAPREHSFTSVARWARGLERLRARFDGGYGPFPRAIVDRARQLFAELIDMEQPDLIHGDFHAQNILRSEREPWLAIDPKGVVGDHMFDVAVFTNDLRNSPNPAEMKPRLARRVALLAELLQVDRQRIMDWSFAQAVLSGWWSYEDHGRGWEGAFAQAEAILELLKSSG